MKTLPLIVFAQFCCTSLWFAGNAVMDELVVAYGLADNALGSLTSAVQFGFICGTLVFAVLSVADRFSPSKVFFASAVAAAACNLGAMADGNTLATLLAGRFGTGFFLAGIYPVGMKIAADYYDKGLGKSLGYLVGALVLGTAFPHLVRGLGEGLPWRGILLFTSAIALLGGGLIAAFVPDGPHRKVGSGIEPTAFLRVFRGRSFRAAALGYFGHMWELYAFWAFLPLWLSARPELGWNISLAAFAIIGAGGLACVTGGYLSQHYGAARVAAAALSTSGLCGLLSPLAFLLPAAGFAAFLTVWGMAVVADSPLFSTLVAGNAPPENKGTALTIVNCIGFAITIGSIQLLGALLEPLGARWLFVSLLPGPVLGLLCFGTAGFRRRAEDAGAGEGARA